MDGGETWESARPFQQLSWWLCEKCDGELTEHRIIVDRHSQEPKAWCCTRCHAYTRLRLPFSPIDPPVGRAQIEAALRTLAIYVPLFMSVDQKRLYRVTGRFFAAGWSVKDILHAIDYRPDGNSHETAAIGTRQPGDILLARVSTRLREWVWRDRFEDEEGGDIMPGPYTTMRAMMRERSEEQQIRAFSRAIEWAERERMAKEAREKGLPALARRQAAIAAALGRYRKRKADQREDAARAEHVARVRNRSGMISVDELISTYWANEELTDVQSERTL